MTDSYTNTDTHASDIHASILTQTTNPTAPDPVLGDWYFNSASNSLFIYNGTTWLGALLS